MTHPHLRIGLEALEQRIGSIYIFKMGTSVFATVGLFNFTTHGMGNKLCAIADAEYGNPADKLRQVDLECLRVVNAIGRTTEDDTNDRRIVLGKLIVGEYLTKSIEFAHTSANELCGLRTEIENNDFLLHDYIIDKNCSAS